MGNFEQYAPGLAHLISMVARATNHYRYRSFGNEVLVRGGVSSYLFLNGTVMVWVRLIILRLQLGIP